MKNLFKLGSKLLWVLLIIVAVSCNKKDKSGASEVTINPNVKGGIPEKILFTVKMDQALALNDIVKGDSDVFIDKIPSSILNKLDDKEKEKLDIYSVPSESWTLLLNPVPNRAPYQIKVNGVTEFNPFAIREVRYALNFLMDRKYIAEQISKGDGEPYFTPATPGNSNAWKFELQAKKMGLSPEGNQVKAIKDITAALEKAANLPENKNKLFKMGGFWYFEGKPVSLKFVIRADDSEGRLKLGNYLAGLLEKTGIKVEKLLQNESKAIRSVYDTDPAQLGWHLYTESLKPDSTCIWQDIPFVQYFSSIAGKQPGWGESTWWNYKNEEADKLANNWFSGKIETIDEHWKNMLRINEIGINEAVRLFVTYQKNSFVANKEKFNERMFFGLGTGISKEALENANTKNGILNVSQYSSTDKPFQSLWDPIGVKGFEDSYSTNVTQLLFDRDIAIGPFGQLNERKVSVVYTKVDPLFERDVNGEITRVSGKISVDEKAMILEPRTNKYKRVGKGIKAAIETTYRINFGVWHSGRDIKKSDYLYAEGFRNDWAYEDGTGEKKFDPAYAAYWAPLLGASVGSRWNADGTVTIWSNKFSPKGGLYNIGGVPSLSVNGNQKSGYAVPWEILEAIQSLVLGNSKSGTKYGFNENEGVLPVDLKSTSFTADLKAKLIELAGKKYVPEILIGEVTPDEAVANYNSAVKFIDTYGHALIGYGPYMLTKLDAKSGYAELTAFRDKKYTEERGKWAKLYRASRLRIDKFSTTEKVRRGKEFEITVNATELVYPTDETKKAVNGSVYALFINKDGETRVDAINNTDGTFTIKMEAETTNSFRGAYTVVIFATLDGKFTDTKTTEVVFN